MTPALLASEAWCDSRAINIDEPSPKEVWLEAWSACLQVSGVDDLRRALLALDSGTGSVFSVERALLDMGLPVGAAERLSRKLAAAS